VLKTSYIDAFASAHASVVNNTQLKYTIVHHYFGLDGNEANTWTVTKGATLGEYGVGAANALTAEELEGTYDGGTADNKSDDIVFKKDDVKTGLLDRGYLYAGGMTYLHVYYMSSSLQEQNKEKTQSFFNSISETSGYEETYFGSSMKFVTNSEGDKELESVADSGWAGLLGQDQLEFTDDFVSAAKEQGFTKIHIQSAQLYIGGITSLADSIFSGGNVRVDTLQIKVADTLIATLNAQVIGYTIDIKQTGTFIKREEVTITFSNITIELPETIEEGQALSISACIAGANTDGTDKQLSGEWTLSGLIFG
jgi:hypothetical protein